jgi:hypothetical protein
MVLRPSSSSEVATIVYREILTKNLFAADIFNAPKELAYEAAFVRYLGSRELEISSPLGTFRAKLLAGGRR